jgi:hypothetical protein
VPDRSLGAGPERFERMDLLVERVFPQFP